MTTRDTITIVLLWISILSWTLWVGGTVYQMLVVVPIWSASLPESLRAFIRNTDYNRTILRFFGPKWMPVRVLPVLGLLVFGWHWTAHRPFFVLAAVCVVIGLVFTLTYVYSINAVLFTQAGGNHTDEEIRSMARRWIVADRARFVLGSVGYLAMLRALSIGIAPPNP